jgi:Ca2+-binding RTX toxin-like protein
LPSSPNARGGKDVAFGGRGDDLIFGGKGNDHLFGRGGIKAEENFTLVGSIERVSSPLVPNLNRDLLAISRLPH